MQWWSKVAQDHMFLLHQVTPFSKIVFRILSWSYDLNVSVWWFHRLLIFKSFPSPLTFSWLHSLLSKWPLCPLAAMGNLKGNLPVWVCWALTGSWFVTAFSVAGVLCSLWNPSLPHHHRPSASAFHFFQQDRPNRHQALPLLAPYPPHSEYVLKMNLLSFTLCKT